MLKVMSAVLALVVSLAVVGDLFAQGGRTGGRRGGFGGQLTFDRIQSMALRGVTLTDDQKAKVADLKTTYDPKVKEAAAAFDSILTADQKKARDDAVKAAKDAGKSQREIFQAGRDAVKLTDDQKTKMDAARKATAALTKEIRDKLTALLTPEQQDQLKKARESRGNRGGGRRGATETN